MMSEKGVRLVYREATHSPSDDRCHYRNRNRKKFCLSWDTFYRPPFGDMVCDLLVSDGGSSIGDGESSGGRFHTDSSFE
jgi:TPP-dependent pyruvate/acetoin dehydrogenase alpha subunit